MTAEVTAIITTHGRPACLHTALESVCAETHGDVEIVIVDDGGESTSFDAGTDMPVRVVRGNRLGVGRARNLGLSVARGEFVIFLDDDDVALPDRISSLLRAARRHHASLCFGMTHRVLSDSSQVLENVPTHRSSFGAVGFCDLLACAPHINAVLARTDTLRAVGGFDAGADHFDDWSAWLRIADQGSLVWSIADTVAEWRIHGRGLSAHVLQRGAMKARLLSLFERLQPCLTAENARAVRMAHQVVTAATVATYDDYAGLMAAARNERHRAATCFGNTAPPRSDVGGASVWPRVVSE